MTIEEEFDLEIPDSDAEIIVTIGDVVKYIEEHKLNVKKKGKLWKELK